MGVFDCFNRDEKTSLSKNSVTPVEAVHQNGSFAASTSSKAAFLSEVQDLVDERNRKLDVLKNMEILVIDNSLRETTVASIKAHTVESKRAIFEEIKKCGFKYYFIEAFNAETRMGDLFLEELIADKEDLTGAFAFCEMWERLEDGVPLSDIPVSLQKCKKFGILNVMIEFDLMYHKVNYEKFDMKKLCKYIKNKVDWIRANLSQKSLIFLNIRDFSNTMKYHPERVWQVVNFLSTLPPEERVTGIAYEDMGKALMDHLAVWTKAVRSEMIRCGWEDGQFIFHVHEQWGMMHATNLAVLAAGATGIWCAVCIEGAALGHADSCTTIINLVRLGNTRVIEQYNCKYLREAAIRVTQIASGEDPDPKQPIYGDRAFDMLFGSFFNAMNEDPMICSGFDMAEFFGVKRSIRISPLASAEMIITKLSELFGDDPQFTVELGEAMRKKIIENAKQNRREEYNSAPGIAILFNQAGGKMTPKIKEKVQAGLKNEKHVEKLIEDIKVKWDIWDSRDDCVDDRLTFDNFYFGFMSHFISCSRGREIDIGLRALDMDDDGMIDWSEFKFYLVWAGRQYPNVQSSDDLLDKAFRFGLIPAMKDEIDKSKGKGGPVKCMRKARPQEIAPDKKRSSRISFAGDFKSNALKTERKLSEKRTSLKRAQTIGLISNTKISSDKFRGLI